MITVCVATEQDLNVGELEPELLNRLLDRRHIALVCTVDQDISLRRGDEERTQGPGADVVDIPDNLVWWKLSRLVILCAHVAFQYRPRCIGTTTNCYRRMIWRRLVVLRVARLCGSRKDQYHRCHVSERQSEVHGFIP